MTRTEIAKELKEAHMIDDFEDYCNIAHALERGKNRHTILYEMPELERWHKAFAFLQERL